MAHFEQQQYVQDVRHKFPSFFRNRKVLEVGSLDINGTVRTFFEHCEYIGIDVGSGPGVDVVCGGQVYSAPDNTFDTIISCECFEHNPFWVETFANMIRMCKSGGLIIMTCAGEGREEHGTTRSYPGGSPLTINVGWGTYYRNLIESDFREKFYIEDLFSVHKFSEHIHTGEANPYAKDLSFWGIKK
jgi:SAM-dependent methyltransferase